MPTQWAHGLACAALVGLVPATASAQSATALDRFEPAPAGDVSVAVPSVNVNGQLRPAVGLVFSYAHAPLRLRTYDLASEQSLDEVAVVDHQLIAHVLASIEIGKRLKVDLDVPFTLSQEGASPSFDPNLTIVPTSSAQSFLSPTGAAMNDIRLGARLVLLRQRRWIPAASLAYTVWFPSGNSKAYTGTGFIRHAPSLIFGAEQGRIAWSVMAGRRVQDPRGDTGLLGSEILGGASIAARFDKLTAHGELFGTVSTTDKSSIASSIPSVELLVGARYSFGPVTAGLMGGPGLFSGIGNPTFRLLATVSANLGEFGKTTPPPASTENKLPKTIASGPPKQRTNTPKQEGPIVTIAPPDRDRDTVPDAEDVCPDIVGDASATATRRGCPPDRDGDEITDADDRCPDEKGVATANPERFGCPPDTDGDGFVDAVDACPNEKGEANEDPTKRGCPKSVRVEGTQIVILQEVNFATGSDKITSDSFSLLEQVAAVFKEHPEIARVAVDGHTDNRGTEKSNLTLSQKRSVAVVKWLVEHGIDARRLEARGFGPRRPIAPNTTDEGKAKNRRVEFQILKRSAEGAAAWKPGSVQ
jgi:OmpA-OmpF porin, OOP family